MGQPVLHVLDQDCGDSFHNGLQSPRKVPWDAMSMSSALSLSENRLPPNLMVNRFIIIFPAWNGYLEGIPVYPIFRHTHNDPESRSKSYRMMVSWPAMLGGITTSTHVRNKSRKHVAPKPYLMSLNLTIYIYIYIYVKYIIYIYIYILLMYNIYIYLVNSLMMPLCWLLW